MLRRNRRNLSRLKTAEAALEQQPEASVMSLKLQKRLAASLLGCGAFDVKVETVGDGMGAWFNVIGWGSMRYRIGCRRHFSFWHCSILELYIGAANIGIQKCA